MDSATELRRAGVSSTLEPGDAGYGPAVEGFDLSTPFAPDVVIDARSPRDVSTAIAVAAGRHQALTVPGLDTDHRSYSEGVHSQVCE